MSNNIYPLKLARVLFLFFFCLSVLPVTASESVIFLGQVTGIADHLIKNNGPLLSEVLAKKEGRCSRRYAYSRPEQRQCLREAVSVLQDQRKISKHEKRILIRIIRDNDPVPAFGENIVFLGSDTGISDHPVRRSGKLLSEILAKREATCAEISKANKQRLCLKRAIRDLRKRGLINRHEFTLLLQIIKGGGVVEPPPEPEPEFATVSGRVSTPDGSPASDILVSTVDGEETKTVITDDNGLFSLTLTPDRQFVLNFTQTDYADQVRRIVAPVGNQSVNLEVTMVRRLAAGSFEAEQGAPLLIGADTATVLIPANAFVYTAGDKLGQLVTGTIDVSITPLDVSMPAALGAFPGDFQGTTEQGVDTPIYSLGTVEYLFTQNGEPLQLADGVRAGITIPIYQDTYQDGSPIQNGDTIPLWRLNEETGIWEQIGEGEVSVTDSATGRLLLAQVDHFSWWNCDVSLNPAQALVTVVGNDGTALVKATTNADLAWRPNTVDTTVALGATAGPLDIPSNAEVCFSADITFTSGDRALTPAQCFTATDNETINVVLQAPVDGALAIGATQHEAVVAGDTVGGFLNFPLDRILLYPLTQETTVDYRLEVVGSLPAGLELRQIDDTLAEISGVPLQSGDFPINIVATSADGDPQANLPMTLRISGSQPPPSMTPVISLNASPNNLVFEMSQFNSGGLATSWSVSQSSGSFTIDADSGRLELFPTPLDAVWRGTVTAMNSAGSSSASVTIQFGGIIAE